MKDDVCEKTDGSESVSTEVTQTTSSRADPSRDVRACAEVWDCGTRTRAGGRGAEGGEEGSGMRVARGGGCGGARGRMVRRVEGVNRSN